VLLSPPRSFKGVTVQKALGFPPLRELPLLILYGNQDATASRDADRLYDRLEPFHSDRDTLVKVGLDTSLQGTLLLDRRIGQRAAGEVAQFLGRQVVRNRDLFPWQERARRP
jgi:hypothetical protein